MLLVCIVWIVLLGASGEKCCKHGTEQQSPARLHSSTVYPTLGKYFHLSMLHLTSAEVKTINISFTSLQLPDKCLDRDLIVENAKSCFDGKNKAGRGYWLQICLGKIRFSEFSACPRDQINQTAALCKYFLAFLRMSPAILEGWALDEGAAAKSSQWVKLSKLRFVTERNVREMFETIICMALSMKCFELDSFVQTLHLHYKLLWQGWCCLLCPAHLPCCR